MNTFLVHAQSNFTISPVRPKAGHVIKASYQPKGTPLFGKKNVTATIYQFTTDYTWRKVEVKLVQQDTSWVLDYKLPEDVVVVAFKFKSGKITDNGQGMAYGWLISGEDDKVLPGAYAGWAFLRNASVPELFPDFTTDKFLIGDDVVDYWMKLQVRENPSTKRHIFYPALKVLKKMDPEKARKQAEEDLSYMKLLDNVNERELLAIKKVYAEILERPAAADSVGRLIASIDSAAIKRRNPEKLEAVKALRNERDIKKLLPMTIDFLERFPMDKADRAFDQQNFINYSKFYSSIAIVSSVEKDSVTFKKYVANAPFGSLADIFYRCMEVPYVSLKSFTAQEAYVYARPVMSRLLQFNQVKPEGFMDVYFSSIPTYANILMHLGKDEPALGFATSAQQKYAYGTATLNEVQAILLERTPGKTAELKQVLEQSMRKNQMTPLMMNMLKKQYVSLQKSEDGYAAYLASLKDVKLDSALENKVREAMIKKEVPDFSVKNNSGKVVKLSDQKGKVVVLDFWASWCAPCKAAFPGMKMAVEKYKNDKDVVFFFVDTQEKIKDYEAYVKKYLKDNNYDFNVLFDTGSSISKSYGVGPIPHKMVIDKNGVLRFSEVGYMGSPSELLDEISMMVELARKEN
ncbi:TlpA family protein disulfide reductase [Pedobacter sp. AW31-3R]|uniref:TlpA family protein disulfide reductase n=1 Tax=Pedobacter sp. AW31-3R TaxID=3445781 RepID=UPI003FA0C09B